MEGKRKTDPAEANTGSGSGCGNRGVDLVLSALTEWVSVTDFDGWLDRKLYVLADTESATRNWGQLFCSTSPHGEWGSTRSRDDV